MDNFTYYNPTKYVFGKNTVRLIRNEIAKFQSKKVLLLYGGGSIFKNGVYDTVSKSLKENGIDFVELGGVKPNPVITKVYEAIDLCRNENVDGILAVGGGSVLDSAKVIASGVFFDGDIWEVFERKAAPPKKALPVFSVLTISATGSETNPFAVITNEKDKKKWAFTAGAVSFPKVAIVDPAVQFSLPREQTLFGAIDMMAHIFEFYFSTAKENLTSREIFEGILRSIIKTLPKVLSEPDNYELRGELALAGTLALSGLHVSSFGQGDWASHAIEHSLSAFYDIPHGAGLAIIFPAWMKYVYENNSKIFERFAEKAWGISSLEDNLILKGIEATEKFFKENGAPTRLKDVNIPESAIPELAENAARLAPLGKIKKLNYEDILNILELAK